MFLLRKAGQVLGLALGVTVLVFLIQYASPGDPARAILGQRATPEQVDDLRRQLGLDRSLVEQYLLFLWNAVRGNLGTSYYTGVPVTEVLAGRAQVTAVLVIASMIISIAMSVGLASLAARWRGGFTDRVVRGIAILALVVPTFWLGIMLVRIIAIPTGVLPVAGLGTGPWDFARGMVLPVLTLSISLIPTQIRALRSTMNAGMTSEYADAARSRGIAQGQVLRRHVLPNSVTPLISIAAVQSGYLLFGTVIVENTFQLGGLGQGLVLAVGQRDYPVVNGTTLLFAFVVIAFSFAGDIVTAIYDPRMRAK